MILSGGRLSAFLARPDATVLAALVYGPDSGMVRERADALAKAVVSNPADPFLSVELTADTLRKDSALLRDEMAALSMTGERRIIRVRDAADGLAKDLEALFHEVREGALLIVESGELPKRSTLRRAFESSDRAVAIPCYGDEGRDLQGLVREMLTEAGMSAAPDALSLLVSNLGGDRMITRREMEKLILYVGEPRTVTAADVAACIDDTTFGAADAVAVAAASGRLEELDGALEKTWSDGQNPVSVLRSVSRHFLRLHFAVGLVASGMAVDRAMSSLKPPVFFKIADAFRRQISIWDRRRLSEALHLLNEAEIDCKSTGIPAQEFCGRALLRIAAMGKRAASGGARGAQSR